MVFWSHWYPCFGFLVTSPPGFKARVGSALFTGFVEAICNVHSLRSTSSANPANFLMASMVASCSPTCMFSEVEIGSGSHGQSPAEEMNALLLCEGPGLITTRDFQLLC